MRKQEVSQFDRKNGQSKDRNKAINDEVHKLVKSGILWESLFPSWVANLVLVKKRNWTIEDVHRHHRLKQSLSKKLLPATIYR